MGKGRIAMASSSRIEALTQATEALLGSPFQWCHVIGGTVTIDNAVPAGGTKGGDYQIADFAIAKYLITNTQYRRFLDDPSGYSSPHWWAYSFAAAQWRHDHPKPKPSAFEGAALPRTRVSWFDSLAFCQWLSAALQTGGSIPQRIALDAGDLATWSVRLPMEQEWQRAALGDSGWLYPWGDHLDETCGNYARRMAQPTPLGNYPNGKSPYEVIDMVGNVWEWCLTG
jgi:iron(II)-dependent oxidoreductase